MKRGRSIHGYPVIGGSERLEDVIKDRQIDQIIISTPKIKEEKVKVIKEICEQTGVVLKKFSLKIED